MGTNHRHSAVKLLEGVVEFHNSVFGWDKTVKNLAYALGLASCAAARIRGPKSALAEGLRQLGSNLSMYRMCTRFAGGPFGVPPELENLINQSWYGGWLDPRIKKCVWWQSITMLGYYPLENLAYLGYIAPRLFPFNADKLCQASCVFWVLWILIDLYATELRLRELCAMEARLRAEGKWTPRARELLQRKRVNLYLYTLRLVFWLPNAMHWCLPPNHPAGLPYWLVQVFGLAESLIGTYTLATARGIGRPALPEADE